MEKESQEKVKVPDYTTDESGVITYNIDAHDSIMVVKWEFKFKDSKED